MALFPKRVDLDQESINQLKALFKETSAALIGIILVLGGTEITTRSAAQARALIELRIRELQSQIGDWALQNVPKHYRRGRQDAIDQLESFDNPAAHHMAMGIILGQYTNAKDIEAIAAASAAGVLLHALTRDHSNTTVTSSELDKLHEGAEAALTDDMAARLRTATTQMGKSASDTVGEALKASIRAKIASTDETTSAKVLKARIQDAIRENGVSALIDKSGRRWAPDVYAEMLARTTLMQARNTGLTNAIASQGYDLVQVSAHGASDACGPWEGATLSLNGNVTGYATVSDATASGLFHVNCRHALNAVDPQQYRPQ